MRRFIYLFCLLPCLLQGQTEMQAKIDSLKFVEEMPYICEGKEEGLSGNPELCGDALFWEVVRLKGPAIPLLVDKIGDMSMTRAVVPLFGYYHTVGDIAYVALKEIVHGIPTLELLGVEFDDEGCGYCVYWEQLNKRRRQRKKFQAAVREWYSAHEGELVWVESDAFSTCDCRGRHPNGGHFELRQGDK